MLNFLIIQIVPEIRLQSRLKIISKVSGNIISDFNSVKKKKKILKNVKEKKIKSKISK